MFLLKAIQEQYLKVPVDNEESVAFVIFNVRGKDLIAIHSPNDFSEDGEGERERVYQEYIDLKLSTEPFKQVKYFIPYSSNSSAKQSTYLPQEDIEEYIKEEQLQKYKYSYEDDKESLEMLFADIDDSQQTMETIISKIIDKTDSDFGNEKVDELSQKSQTQERGAQKLEPHYKNYVGMKHQTEYIDEHFGPQKDLLLMDNNVFASKCFDRIIDEIKECAFEKDATYMLSNEYKVAHPIYNKLFHRSKRKRYIDFNQMLDAKLATKDKMQKLSEINIRPLHIAFDHYEQKDIYIKAVMDFGK